MKRKKAFDCVGMKDSIQAQHAKDYAGMTDNKRWETVESKLAVSDDIVARKWRGLRKRQRTAAR